MQISNDIIGAIVAGAVAGIFSWITFLIAFSNKFGKMETKVDGISERMDKLEDSKDVVRWSQLGQMTAMNVSFPSQRIPEQ